MPKKEHHLLPEVPGSTFLTLRRLHRDADHFVESVAPLFPDQQAFAKRDNEAFTAPKLYVVTVNKPLRLGDGFAVVSAGEALETDEVAIVADNVGPILPSALSLTLEPPKPLGNKSQCVGVALARAEAEESAMPVLIMWAVPAVIVIGGVGYFLVRAVH
jgi:hypothetical protein